MSVQSRVKSNWDLPKVDSKMTQVWTELPANYREVDYLRLTPLRSELRVPSACRLRKEMDLNMDSTACQLHRNRLLTANPDKRGAQLGELGLSGLWRKVVVLRKRQTSSFFS